MVECFFRFCTASFDFYTTCEMALGVRNFSHALQKFHRVCEMSSYGAFIFAQCAKLVRRVCEIFAPHAK